MNFIMRVKTRWCFKASNCIRRAVYINMIFRIWLIEITFFFTIKGKHLECRFNSRHRIIYYLILLYLNDVFDAWTHWHYSCWFWWELRHRWFDNLHVNKGSKARLIFTLGLSRCTCFLFLRTFNIFSFSFLLFNIWLFLLNLWFKRSIIIISKFRTLSSCPWK